MTFALVLNGTRHCEVEAKGWEEALILAIKDNHKLMVFAGLKPSICKRNLYGTKSLLDVFIQGSGGNLFIGEQIT